MKRLTLLFACALFFGVTATFAQDTTRTRKQDQKQDQTKQSNQYKKNETDEMKGYTKVQMSEIPQGLRSTLSSGTQYKGWDDTSKGGVYKNASGDYVVRIHNGSERKVFHFDKDGNPVPQPRDH